MVSVQHSYDISPSMTELLQERRSVICYICLDDSVSKSHIMSLCCGSVTHYRCYFQWTKSNKTCPCCLESLENSPSSQTRSISSNSLPTGLEFIPTQITSPAVVNINRIYLRRAVPILSSPHPASGNGSESILTSTSQSAVTENATSRREWNIRRPSRPYPYSLPYFSPNRSRRLFFTQSKMILLGIFLLGCGCYAFTSGLFQERYRYFENIVKMTFRDDFNRAIAIYLIISLSLVLGVIVSSYLHQRIHK